MTSKALPAAGSTLDPYLAFQKFSPAITHNTGVILLEAIRAAHPDKHVTPFSDKDFDIVKWAAAVGAQMTLERQDAPNFVCVEYDSPPNRISEIEGKLEDKVIYGLYRLIYQDETYTLYTGEWVENLFGNKKKLYYMLSPLADAREAGSSPAAVESLLLEVGRWTARLHDEIYVFDGGEWTKNEQLWKAIQKCSWDDIVLEPGAKQALSGDVHGFFDSRALYQSYAVPWKRGMIFYGSPGCGKTMSIKAIMSSLDKRRDGVVSLVVRRMDTTCMEPQDGIRLIFDHARAMAPCLLVFEDLDSMVTDKARSYFLNEVDGLESNDGICMIGSTNHLERLDAGISKRPSRFDRKFHFKLPAFEQRVSYCEAWRSKLEGNDNVDFDPAISHAVAELTEGFSYAYLKELLVQSLLSLARSQAPDGQHGADHGGPGDDGQNHGQDVGGEEVPEHLRDNALMRKLREQVVALRVDMESAEEEPAKLTPEESESEN